MRHENTGTQTVWASFLPGMFVPTKLSMCETLFGAGLVWMQGESVVCCFCQFVFNPSSAILPCVALKLLFTNSTSWLLMHGVPNQKERVTFSYVSVLLTNERTDT